MRFSGKSRCDSLCRHCRRFHRCRVPDQRRRRAQCRRRAEDRRLPEGRRREGHVAHACIGIVADPCIAVASKTAAYIKDSRPARRVNSRSGRRGCSARCRAPARAAARRKPPPSTLRRRASRLARKTLPAVRQGRPGHGARRRHRLPPASDRDPRARDRTAGRRRQSALSAWRLGRETSQENSWPKRRGRPSCSCTAPGTAAGAGGASPTCSNARATRCSRRR